MISGHSVFSRDAVQDAAWHKMRGGLTGTSFMSIEELDKKVDAMIEAPEWLADYEAMRKRRDKDA